LRFLVDDDNIILRFLLDVLDMGEGDMTILGLRFLLRDEGDILPSDRGRRGGELKAMVKNNGRPIMTTLDPVTKNL
jgi:hypothetical protein